MWCKDMWCLQFLELTEDGIVATPDYGIRFDTEEECLEYCRWYNVSGTCQVEPLHISKEVVEAQIEREQWLSSL